MTDSVNANPDGHKEPARSQSIPGPTYENPNEDQHQEPHEDEVAPDDEDEDHPRP